MRSFSSFTILISYLAPGSVEVHAVDDALQERVLPGDGPHVRGDALADPVGELADDGPDGLLGIVRHEGEVEADELVVSLGELKGLLARADFLGDAVQLVVEDVAEALGEDEGEDIVLVFRRVLGPADGAGGVADPGFEGFGVGIRRRHGGPVFVLCASGSSPSARGTCEGSLRASSSVRGPARSKCQSSGDAQGFPSADGNCRWRYIPPGVRSVA